MSRIVSLVVLGTSLALAACADPVAPRATAPGSPSATTPLTIPQVFARFVALGTSNSMGVQSAGIFAAGQQASWPAEVARRAGMPFSLPLVQDPGCGPPLVPPLASDLALVGGFGNDLVTTVMNTCAPLRSGVTLPANSVAISGADVHDALTATVESKMALSTRVGTLYSRVLPPGKTQVSAMLDQNPTFVSVELTANDVLPASTGRIDAMTPYDSWASDYDQVLAAVRSTGARAVLVGLPTNAAQFPSIRSSREFFKQGPALLELGISVSVSCYFSTNQLFIPGYLLTLVSKAPTTATCADVPGAADYVLTASDIDAINARIEQMNAHVQAMATDNGWAYFDLDPVYALPKPAFRITDLLFSNQPFGPYISLDGVHPSPAGQSLLASAAVAAINAKYGLTIP
jgi:lysophospholipase L1-like esterase